MPAGNPVSGHSHNLLITESPVIARIISAHNIPYLSVVATSGYLWTPEIDASGKNVKGRANPDLLERRKEIRELAKWAKRVIIATDSDPSGEFIAWSLFRFLKSHPDIRRTHLTSPDDLSVQRSLENAKPFQDDDFSRLRNYLLSRNYLDSALKIRFPDLPADIRIPTLLTSLFLNADLPRKTFHDPVSGVRVTAETPVRIFCDDVMPLQKSDQTKNHAELTKPFSTASLLDEILRNTSVSDYKNAQQLLQSLFQSASDDLPAGLISYPRTSSRDFFSETSQNLIHKFRTLDQAFTPLPDNLIPNEDSSPHEAIHVLRPQITPDIVRPHVKRDEWILYKLIWQNSRESLSSPRVKPLQIWGTEKMETNFLTENAVSENHLSVSPSVTSGDLMQFWTDSGWMSSGSAGRMLDQMIQQNMIEIRENRVYQTKRLPKLKNRSLGDDVISTLKNKSAADDVTGVNFFTELLNLPELSP